MPLVDSSSLLRVVDVEWHGGLLTGLDGLYVRAHSVS